MAVGHSWGGDAEDIPLPQCGNLEEHPNCHELLSTELCDKFPRGILASPSLDACKSGSVIFPGDVLQSDIVYWI